MKEFTVKIGGLYQHYKGNKYIVTGVGKHTETEEKFVIYRSFDNVSSTKYWIRPISMWDELINDIPRFKFISD